MAGSYAKGLPDWISLLFHSWVVRLWGARVEMVAFVTSQLYLNKATRPLNVFSSSVLSWEATSIVGCVFLHNLLDFKFGNTEVLFGKTLTLSVKVSTFNKQIHFKYLLSVVYRDMQSILQARLLVLSLVVPLSNCSCLTGWGVGKVWPNPSRIFQRFCQFFFVGLFDLSCLQNARCSFYKVFTRGKMLKVQETASLSKVTQAIWGWQRWCWWHLQCYKWCHVVHMRG